MIKRGQITIFIIISILVVASGALIYFIYPNLNIINLGSDPIKETISECLNNAILESAQIFGYQQGYSELPTRYLDTGISSIAYYYFEGDIIIPRNDVFEVELSKIINDKITEDCTDFVYLEEEGFEVELGKYENSVEILEEIIKVRVDFPIRVIDGEDVKKYSKFSYEIPIRLGHIIDVSRNLVEIIREDPGTVDLTFFLNQDLEISINEYDECNQVYIVLDPESESIEIEESYTYSFGVKLEDRYCIFENGV